MKLRTLPPAEDAIERFLEELWLPYHRDLEDAVDAHAIVEDIDEAAPKEQRVEFWLENLEPDSARAWVAVDEGGADDSATGADRSIAELDAELVGFVTTHVDECPDVFDRPDQLLIEDIYVESDYRVTGLARQLIERAAQRAEEAGCRELTLNVDVDNERALSFYEKMGFEPLRHKFVAGADEI